MHIKQKKNKAFGNPALIFYVNSELWVQPLFFFVSHDFLHKSRMTFYVLTLNVWENLSQVTVWIQEK